MADAIIVFFSFVFTAFVIAWATLFPTIGVLWLLGVLS